VRWVGWGLAALVFGLIALHTRNFLALRGWGERARQMSRARRAVDVAISFLIPAVILVVVFSQVKAFYGDRFSLWRSLIYMPWGLPDVFILLLIGTLPDFTQGVIKLFSLRPERQRSSPATMRHQDTGASA
jgi:hypothetical protein